MSSHDYVLRKVPAAQWKQWDQFVNEHPRGHFLQSWGWGELKANGGWYPLRLALMDEQQQQIVAAAQVLCRTPAHLPLWTGHLAYIPTSTSPQSKPTILRASKRREYATSNRGIYQLDGRKRGDK